VREVCQWNLLLLSLPLLWLLLAMLKLVRHG